MAAEVPGGHAIGLAETAQEGGDQSRNPLRRAASPTGAPARRSWAARMSRFCSTYWWRGQPVTDLKRCISQLRLR